MSFAPRTLAVIDAALYLIATLGFALIWHIHAFEAIYTSLNWPNPGPPEIALGFLAIITQGLVLGLLFQRWVDGGALGKSAASFCAIMFVFLWSSHVIGDAAKCGFLPKSTFVAIETAYLVVQFMVYWAILVVVHRLFDARAKT